MSFPFDVLGIRRQKIETTGGITLPIEVEPIELPAKVQIPTLSGGTAEVPIQPTDVNTVSGYISLIINPLRPDEFYLYLFGFEDTSRSSFESIGYAFLDRYGNIKEVPPPTTLPGSRPRTINASFKDQENNLYLVDLANSYDSYTDTTYLAYAVYDLTKGTTTINETRNYPGNYKVTYWFTYENLPPSFSPKQGPQAIGRIPSDGVIVVVHDTNGNIVDIFYLTAAGVQTAPANPLAWATSSPCTNNLPSPYTNITTEGGGAQYYFRWGNEEYFTFLAQTGISYIYVFKIIADVSCTKIEPRRINTAGGANASYYQSLAYGYVSEYAFAYFNGMVIHPSGLLLEDWNSQGPYYLYWRGLTLPLEAEDIPRSYGPPQGNVKISKPGYDRNNERIIRWTFSGNDGNVAKFMKITIDPKEILDYVTLPPPLKFPFQK